MTAEPEAVNVRILYVSRSKGPQTTTVTTSILLQAQVHNRVMGITGLLCQGPGVFLQVLEGERSRVNSLYRRICRDSRHKDIELLSHEEITERRFKHWSMALVKMQDLSLDPYTASGNQVMQLVEDLIASGQPITAP